jgi:hypothetical protein
MLTFCGKDGKSLARGKGIRSGAPRGSRLALLVNEGEI